MAIDLVQLEKQFDKMFEETTREEFWRIVQENRRRDKLWMKIRKRKDELTKRIYGKL